MNPRTILIQLLSFSVVISGSGARTPAVLLNSLNDGGPACEVVERGQDFAVCRAVTTTTDTAGRTSFRTNQFTLLENGLHYQVNGNWEVSEDIVEPFPGGAIALRGPWKTIFSSDLNSESVFDIQTPEGQRIRGGVRAIQLTDFATGQSVVLGTVKKSVPGVVVPPNQVVYESAFDGLDADVLFVSRHNSISQNVILKQRPTLPQGMDPATTRLEVVTELIECPQPTMNSVTLKKPGQPDLRDDVTIGFGSLQAMRGKAFSVNDAKALVLTGDHLADDGTISVVKRLYQLEDGRQFLIESVGWQEIQPSLAGLMAAKIDLPQGGAQLADSRVWPKTVSASPKKKALQMAAAPYKTSGFLVDVDLSGSTTKGYTFLSGTTYYIAQSFYVSATSTTTFKPGCVIKYGFDAWLLLHCPFTFPPSGQSMPVLTSKDDDSFGSMVPGSTHNPTYMARQALLVYYVVEQTTEIRNTLIRWANKGIEYDAYPGVGVQHNVQDSLFQRCQTGVYADVPDGGVSLINVRKCNVTTPFICNCDSPSGSMTDDCGPLYTTAAFLGVQSGEVFDGQSLSNPPDTMGAIGPNHFIELIRGGIVIFDRWTGQRIGAAGIDNFFRYTVGGTTYPRAPWHMTDPRIIYDHRSGRWFASAMENISQAGNQVLLAVSKGSDPIGDPSSDWKSLKWDRVLIDLKNGSSYIDQPTLGVDDNGVYICANTAGGLNIAAIGKSSLLAVPITLNASYFKGISGASFVKPAVNFDPVPGNGAAWIVAHRQSQYQDIVYATITWSAGVPSLSPWTILSTPAFGGEIQVPSKGSPNSWYHSGTVLQQAVIRNSELWTCRQVGVNASGGASNPDRDACEWLRLSLTGTSAALIDSGRVYDSSPSNQKFYFYPSIMVNGAGSVLMAFSGSGQNDYIGAFCAGRFATDPLGQMSSVKTLQAGQGAYLFSGWGDYSHTTLDPNDGLGIWTVQEYARTPTSTWGTWIGEIELIKP